MVLTVICPLHPEFRSPSITTIRDIDPKLPTVRHNFDYPLSDGEWPASEGYVCMEMKPMAVVSHNRTKKLFLTASSNFSV